MYLYFLYYYYGVQKMVFLCIFLRFFVITGYLDRYYFIKKVHPLVHALVHPIEF
jgi:hypothetical protein